MSRVNLRAAFAVSIDSRLSAQQVFTDRVPEVDAFWASQRSLRETLAASEISPVTDRTAPRRNVLVYYGVGGIGKTTLSRELERRLLSHASRADDHAAVRLDFGELSGLDMEAYLLRLRAGLGPLAPRWPAFDLAFKVYWDNAHPEDPLDEFITRGSSGRRLARPRQLSQQMSESITSVIGEAVLGGVAGIAYNLGAGIVSRVKETVTGHRVLRRCELLPELLDADPTPDTLSYLPYLLAWDLDNVPLARRTAVVFLDTYENLTLRGGRQAEKLLQRSVYFMPNVLFVITGRNRVDWGDLPDASELDFVGPGRWPQLATARTGTEPRQHLVGYLSEQDADNYLRTAVSREGQPAIPADFRQRIVAASAGLPLYLDLAVNTYLDIVSRGHPPTAADFGQPLPAVTARMIRDLDRDERELLRAAALLEAFTLATLHAGCPQLPDAALLRFRQRLFLEYDPDRIWPYSLHDVLREAILEADVGLADSWSPRERARVARRMATHLGEVVASSQRSADTPLATAAFQQAVDLGAATGQFFPWLVDAAQSLVMSGSWSVVSGGGASGEGDTMTAFLRGLAGVHERRSGRLSTAVSMLSQARDAPGLPDRLRRFLILHRGHALRVAGRYAEAAADYAELSGGQAPGGEFRADAVYWLSDYTFLDGRFEEALTALDTLTDQPPALLGEILRLRGHVHRVNALFADAESHYRAALDLAVETGNAAAEGKALTDLVQTLAWCRPHDAAAFHTRAVETNERLRNLVELVKLHAAWAVTSVGLADFDTARQETLAGLELTEQCGYRGGLIWCWAASAFSAVRRGDAPGCRDAARRVTEIADGVGGNRFWGEITHWWAGAGTGDAGSATRWMGGTAAAARRWKAVAEAPAA